MKTMTDAGNIGIGTRYLGAARLVELSPDAERARVVLSDTPDASEVWAVIATISPTPLQPGDEVLVMGEQAERMFVVGVIRQAQPAARSRIIPLANGAYALVAGTPPHGKIQVHSPAHDLVLEYDARTGKTRVGVESGDLEFATRNGDISFRSPRAIRLTADSVEAVGLSKVELKSNKKSELCVALSLSQKGIQIDSSNLRVVAKAGEFDMEDVAVKGRSWQFQSDSIRLAARRIETIGEDIITQAKNIYQTVEKLTQLQTGRFRAFVRATFHLKAKNASLDAEQEFKIDGDQINLG